MSIYNSQASLHNISDETQMIGSLMIPVSSFVNIWDTKSVNVSQVVWDNFNTIKDNHNEMYILLRDGYIQMMHDGLYLTFKQSLSVLNDMYSQIEKNVEVTKLLSTGVKTDSLKEDDGRQIVTPSPIGIGWNVYFTGYDDDADQFAIYQQNPFAPSGRGDGRPFLVEVAGEEADPTIEEFSFVEPLHVHDGEINWGPDGYWDYKDRFSIGIRFTATEVTVTPGTGNCNLVSVVTGQPVLESSGFEIIIPAAGDGYFSVDLAAACPIRNTKRTGYWDVDEETGTISASTNMGGAMFDLYTFAPQDAWLMKNIATANYRHIMEPDVYRTELIHPSWKVIMSVTKLTPGVGWLTGWFTCFRKNVQ